MWQGGCGIERQNLTIEALVGNAPGIKIRAASVMRPTVVAS